MFGTRAADSTLFIAISIALTLVLIISFCIWLMNIENDIAGTICLTLCIIAIVYVATINIYSKKQGTDNIKEAITDNYSNAENILVQFEVINNTLVINNGETVVKYISGDNY